MAEYERARRRRHAYGRSPLVSTGLVKAYLLQLADQGMSRAQIARVVSVGESTLSAIVCDSATASHTRVRATTAQRILTAQPTNSAPCLVEAIGTRRRLQALVCLGWSQQQLAQELGWSRGNTNALILGLKGTHVQARTAARVSVMYDRLWDCPPHPITAIEHGTAHRSKTLARAHGWVSPLAWDDDTINNPQAAPSLGRDDADVDEVAIQRALSRPVDDQLTLTSLERELVLQELLSRGVSAPKIAARLGISARTIERRRTQSVIPAGVTRWAS